MEKESFLGKTAKVHEIKDYIPQAYKMIRALEPEDVSEFPKASFMSNKGSTPLHTSQETLELTTPYPNKFRVTDKS